MELSKGGEWSYMNPENYMRNQIWALRDTEVDDLAKAYFIEICGQSKNPKTTQKKIDRGLEALKNIEQEIEVTVLLSEYDENCIKGSNIYLEDIQFECRALSQIPDGEISGIYIYLLTLGEISLPQNSVLNAVYYDMWQTAYVDAGKESLRRRLQNQKSSQNQFISESFGPGFYGMEASQVKQFFEVLNAEKISLKLMDSGLMYPLKSYAGFFLVTEDPQVLPTKDCKDCMAHGKNCIYCKANRG